MCGSENEVRSEGGVCGSENEVRREGRGCEAKGEGEQEDRMAGRRSAGCTGRSRMVCGGAWGRLKRVPFLKCRVIFRYLGTMKKSYDAEGGTGDESDAGDA